MSDAAGSFPVHPGLSGFRRAVTKELWEDIVPFWCDYGPDHEQGGFIGRLTNGREVVRDAPKGLILNTRILWTFSALFQVRPDPFFRELADRALEYFTERFVDPLYGGAYWLLDARGQVINNMKKIYGQAFVIYSLSEYFAAFGDSEALRLARETFDLIEKHNRDAVHGGYFEASNRNWTIAEQMRLSERDLNERKSMNTHLHLMEAYTNLYRVWPDPQLRQALQELLAVIRERIAEPHSHHFFLFFDDEWHPRSSAISFGHEIEASWLLDEAVKVSGTEPSPAVRELSVQLADTVLREGFAGDFGIYSECSREGKCSASLQWWQQAEAVVGLLNAFQLCGEERYWRAALRAWEFIERHVVDRRQGEWFYEITSERKPNLKLFKICEWKGPYHNTRACLEILRRLEKLNPNQEEKLCEPG